MSQINIREVAKKEFIKCAEDANYCFGTYCNIQHPTKRKIKFKLYPFQEDTLNQFIQNSYNIILKSRQMGISTLVAAYSLWKMMFISDYKVLVIATNQSVARNIVKKVQVMYEGLPVWLRPQFKEMNRLGMTLKNGSEIKAVSSSSSAARSEAVSLLIIDEAAFIDNLRDIWASAKLTLATGGDCILLSTPNGVGNLFHSLWKKAEEGEGVEGLKAFNPIRLNWDLHPERDQKWRDQQTQDLGPQLAAQECDCDFLSSGTSVIDLSILDWYKNEIVTDPAERRGAGGDYWLWEYPDYSKTYLVSIDVARGDGSDDSAIQVFEPETMTQVAEFRGKVGTRELGHMALAICNEWNQALAVIDNKNIGWDVVQSFIDAGYPNLFYSYKNDPFLDENIHIRKNYDLKNKKDMVPGFTTTPTIRGVMVSKLDTYVGTKSVKIKSIRTINELETFIWLRGKAQAMEGHRDDLTSALMQFLFVRDTALKLKSLGIELTKRALNKTFKSVYIPSNRVDTPWNQRVNGKNESLTWLL